MNTPDDLARAGIRGHEQAEKKPSILKSNRQNPNFYTAMWRDTTTNGRWAGDLWNRRKNGEVYLQLNTRGKTAQVGTSIGKKYLSFL